MIALLSMSLGTAPVSIGARLGAGARGCDPNDLLASYTKPRITTTMTPILMTTNGRDFELTIIFRR